MNAGQKWRHIVDGRIAVFRASVAAEGSRNEMEEYLAGADALFTTKGQVTSYHLKVDDLTAMKKAVVSRVKENSAFPRKYVQDSLGGIKAYLGVTELCGNVPAGETLSVDQMKERFENYTRTYRKYFTFVIPRVEIEPILAGSITESLVQRVGEARARDSFSKLVKSPTPAESKQEQMNLMKLAMTILEGAVPDYSELLMQHHRKYRWLNCANIDDDPFAYDYYESRLIGLLDSGSASLASQLHESRDRLASDEQSYRQLVEEIGIADELLDRIETMRQYMWLRTYRVEMQYKANFAIQNLINEIARRYGITRRNMAALTAGEILGLLRGEPIPDVDTLEGRLRDYVLLSEGGTIHLWFDREGREIARRELGSPDAGIGS